MMQIIYTRREIVVSNNAIIFKLTKEFSYLLGLECVDMSRVVIKIPEYITDKVQTPVKRFLPADIFGEMDCPVPDLNNE